jgi:hypothetical protein
MPLARPHGPVWHSQVNLSRSEKPEAGWRDHTAATAFRHPLAAYPGRRAAPRDLLPRSTAGSPKASPPRSQREGPARRVGMGELCTADTSTGCARRSTPDRDRKPLDGGSRAAWPRVWVPLRLCRYLHVQGQSSTRSSAIANTPGSITSQTSIGSSFARTSISKLSRVPSQNSDERESLS